MSEFERDRFKFSIKKKIGLIDNNIVADRGREIIEIKQELLEYKVILKDLVFDSPNYSTRNTILNIAYFIIEETEIFDYVTSKKEIPISKLIKLMPISRGFLEKWVDYIITYMIILANPKYKYVQDYLGIVESVHILGADEIKEDLTVEEYTGLVISKKIKSAIILTSKGEFKKIKANDNPIEGEEINGIEKNSLKKYKLQLSIFAALIMIICTIIVFKYKHVESTVMIETTSLIKVDVNAFNRIVNFSSTTSKGKELLASVNIQDENVDKGICDILQYALENEMIINKEIALTVTGRQIDYNMLKITEDFLLENDIYAKFNNSGNEHLLTP